MQQVPTCDLCDAHKGDTDGAFRVLSPVFRSFGARPAFSGAVTTVITPSNTRMNVTRALRALKTKRESLPPKKHGNIPL